MKQDSDIESQMLDALELFQYAHRYRNQLLVLILENEVPLLEILPDLKVLLRADIVALIVCKGSNHLAQLTHTLSERGMPLQYLARPLGANAEELRLEEIKEFLERRITPVVGFSGSAGEAPENRAAWELGMQLADNLDSNRVFIVSTGDGLKRGNTLLPLLSHNQLVQLRGSKSAVNVPDELLSLIEHYTEFEQLDIVLISGHPGNLFQEIFTHQGSGTLFTDEHPNEIRRARLSDVFDLITLIKPWVRMGTLLPVTDDDIAANASSFFVYTVNSAIVAAARLIPYGDSAQIARICTLPRYRRRGYAKDLTTHLIEIARQENKHLVFALSIEPLMWQLFKDLGFNETPREALPAEWQQGYDFSRPSKAFALAL